MAHYLIFVPNRHGALGHFEAVGLKDLERRGGWDWMEVDKGPDGSQGVVGTYFDALSGENPARGIVDEQKWIPSPANPEAGTEKGAWWYGYEPARPPTPLDLVYPTVMAGKEVSLKDGNSWLIPEALQLPMRIGRDPESGEVTKIYSEKYEKFCKQSEKYVEILFENIVAIEIQKRMHPSAEPTDIKAEFTLTDLWDYCCEALSLNYRVCDPIIGYGFLDLIDDRDMARIALATIAFPDIYEVIEKKKNTSNVSIGVTSSI